MGETVSAMPSYPPHKNLVGADPSGIFNWLSIEDVQAYAATVDKQFDAVNSDAYRAAGLPNVAWDLRVGTAWQETYNGWKKFNDELQTDGFFTFGTGNKWKQVEEYQSQAKDWQKRIADISGQAPSANAIALPVNKGFELGTGTLTVAALVAVAAIIWGVKK